MLHFGNVGLDCRISEKLPMSMQFAFCFNGGEFLIELKEYWIQVNDNIKFTIKHSKDRVSFLDKMVHLSDDGELWIEVYTIATDSCCYSHYESAHLYHMSLPYSQFLPVNRICIHD